jgi:acetolactate synthase-1/2/3 large subunit
MRAAAMTEADVVLVVGRKLDYQLGYGSPAVFPEWSAGTRPRLSWVSR